MLRDVRQLVSTLGNMRAPCVLDLSSIQDLFYKLHCIEEHRVFSNSRVKSTVRLPLPHPESCCYLSSLAIPNQDRLKELEEL